MSCPAVWESSLIRALLTGRDVMTGSQGEAGGSVRRRSDVPAQEVVTSVESVARGAQVGCDRMFRPGSVRRDGAGGELDVLGDAVEHDTGAEDR